MEGEEETFLRPMEVTRILGISYSTLWMWIKSGRIRAVKTPTGKYRIPYSEVKRILEGRVDGGNREVEGSG